MRAPRFKPRTTTSRPRRSAQRSAAAGGLIATLALLLGLSAPAGAISTPNLATIASGTIPVGATITDTALVGGGTNPIGGTIVFTIYGPGDTKCANAPVFTSPPVKVGVPTTVSPAYQATSPGTYQLIAAYSGDANNAAVSGTCGGIGESVLVTQATPALTTAASPVSSAGTVSDTAVLTGGFKPAGTVTFRLYGPGDATCSSPVFNAVVAASVSTVSPAFHPASAGAYRWIATYSGDANNVTVVGSCSDPAETVSVTAVATGPPPAADQPACSQATAQALANSVLAALTAALTGAPAVGFKTTCSAGLRIVLRAKEIRPGNRGFPRHDGFTTIANNLTHTTTTGQLAFSLNAQGIALKAYAAANSRSITAFAIVHVRPDRTLLSSEALQILTLG
ncbi:MAG: hypothetical protein QOH12_3877 [Solirubrobacteraceae bacterium]|jgi:hypothetical protein|nr:hypothetical protein [Solirubrobacteraceae bacterium]